MFRRRKKKITEEEAPGTTVAPLLETEQTPETENIKLMDTEDFCPVRAGSVHGIGTRGDQQDSFGFSDFSDQALVEEKGILAVMADGMGGLSDGGRMSQIVVLSMLQGFDEAQETDCSDLLLRLVDRANEDVNRDLGEGQIGKCGSTVTAVHYRQGLMSWISVGDSHIYAYRNGQLLQMNRDHNYGAELDEMVRQGEISEEEALSDPQRKALTSFIGMGNLRFVDQNDGPLVLESNDRVLLMSDGVFGTLSDQEIIEIMKRPIGEACPLLNAAVQQKGKLNQDNYTCLVLEIK